MTTIQTFRLRALQSHDAIEPLSNKWRIPVLHLLTPGPLRPNKLQSAIEQLSPKVLTQTLCGLERDGLIERRVRNVIPAHVEYRLTPMGESVLPVLRNLCIWAKANASNREDARRRFDQWQKSSGNGSVPTEPRRRASRQKSRTLGRK